ncbi:hypothetical protein PYW07_001501 [Mythimna separata]|uniref:Tyr recombinase domain-containing protein n=1 Tax=Mythimna separata TaxID=271217 RepID=A0AAD8DVZ9_MYTSE|nr:hypothetical protein PYW07_001501 [Mythimna separata]
MLSSFSKNTLKQYNVTYKIWWEFCQKQSIDPFTPSIPIIMYFLTEQFNLGASYGSLNSHKSALAVIIGSKIGDDDRVKRLLKGFYKIKPPGPKYHTTWDPSKVLNVLKTWTPNTSLNFEKLSKKLVMLLALSTAQRAQTLSLIKIPNITVNHAGVHISITDAIKTSGLGRSQPNLFLPFFEKIEICPASTLRDYINFTQSLRGSNTHLILSLNKPHKPVSPSTISRWIKNTLSVCGIDISIFSGHSTRHASTSTANAKRSVTRYNKANSRLDK